MSKQLVSDALKQAIGRRRPPKGVIFHSDRGSQYASHDFQATYYDRVGELLYKWLNRRSQRKSLTWESFNKYLKLNPLPKSRITHRLSNGQFISLR